MKLPGGDAAVVELQKLTGYCLDPEHRRGKHKARVFATLGFTAENAEELPFCPTTRPTCCERHSSGRDITSRS